MNKVKEMDKFLDRYNFPRLNVEEIKKNMNRQIISIGIETMI